jgi:hypothetical protein
MVDKRISSHSNPLAIMQEEEKESDNNSMSSPSHAKKAGLSDDDGLPATPGTRAKLGWKVVPKAVKKHVSRS